MHVGRLVFRLPGWNSLLRFVRLSSERARQAVRQDCSFATKQESRPALLVVVPQQAPDVTTRDSSVSHKAALDRKGSFAWSSRLPAGGATRPSHAKPYSARCASRRRFADEHRDPGGGGLGAL
jgi:hypothetical protein